MDYDLRGSHRWIQDVVSHEFTHIVQLGKSMRYGDKLLGAYIQKLGYEDEKRDDVLFRYVGFKYGQKRVMRIYTNE